MHHHLTGSEAEQKGSCASSANKRLWAPSNWRWPCRGHGCQATGGGHAEVMGVKQLEVAMQTVRESDCANLHSRREHASLRRQTCTVRASLRVCVMPHTHTHTRTTSPCTVVRLAKHTLATRSCQKTDATELIEWVSERSRVEVWLRRWSRACRAWCRVSCACPNTNGRGALPSHTHTSLIHLSWPHPTTPCELAPSDHTLRCAALCKLMSSAPLSHL
jgi:hypothetical protein